MNEHVAALRAASGVIFAAHLLKTGFALAMLGPFGMELSHVASGGDLVSVASFAMQEAPRQVAAAQWVVCAYLLAGPLLTQLVLAALIRRSHPARAALFRYRHALGLSTLRFGALGACAAGALALSIALAEQASPELEITARVGPLGLGAVLLAWLSTVHDAAAARLALAEAPRAFDAVLRGARATSLKLIATHLLFALAGLLCYALGEVASRTLWPSLGLPVSQALALAAAFANAAWLSTAIAKTHQSLKAGYHEPATTNQPELTGL